jgi:hypothetical protein
MTCENSAEQNSLPMDLPTLMSSAAASRARTSHSLESALASKVRDLVSGGNTRGSLANYDRASSSWKTSQACLVSGWEPFAETWPRSGMMQSGTVCQLPPSAPLTDGIVSGLLPTPNTMDHLGPRSPEAYARAKTAGGCSNLKDYVQFHMLPTQSATSYGSNQGGAAGRVGPVRHSLESMARHNLWPTPTTRDWKSGCASQETRERNARPLSEEVGGALNPTWVEWLMGFPLGWTDLKDWATRSSRKSPRSSVAPSSQQKD